MKNRPEGFYHVQQKDATWTIARWGKYGSRSMVWYLATIAGGKFNDNEFMLIDERPIVRTPIHIPEKSADLLLTKAKKILELIPDIRSVFYSDIENCITNILNKLMSEKELDQDLKSVIDKHVIAIFGEFQMYEKQILGIYYDIKDYQNIKSHE